MLVERPAPSRRRHIQVNSHWGREVLYLAVEGLSGSKQVGGKAEEEGTSGKERREKVEWYRKEEQKMTNEEK